MCRERLCFVVRLRRRELGGLGMLSVFLLLATFGCAAEEGLTSAQFDTEFPEPRWPSYLVDTQPEGLLEAARAAVRQSTGKCPLGLMQSGQTVHVLIQWGQDMEVWEAIKQAWAERGIEAHAVEYWEIMGMSKEEYEVQVKESLIHGDEAWKEIINFEIEYKQFFPQEIQKEFKVPLGDGYIRKEGFL